MYIVQILKKTCSFYLTSLIVLGVLLAQDGPTADIKNGFIVDKTDQLVKILQEIPKYADNINIGPLKLETSFMIVEQFTDNVFGASNDKVGDFFATYKPSLGLSLPFRKHSLDIDYSANIVNYLRIQERNHFDHNLTGSLNLNFRNGFRVLLSERISSIRKPGGITRRENPGVIDEEGDDPVGPEDPEIDEEFTFNAFTNRKDITTNVVSAIIDLPNFLSKFDFQLRYSNRDINYQRDRSKSSERNEDTFGGDIIINPLPKVRIKTGFEYRVVRYPSAKQKDSTSHRIPFNVSWRPTKKSNFFINSSLNERDYGNDGIFKNFHGWEFALGYEFDITDRDNLEIKLERSLDEQQFRTNMVVLPGDSLPTRVGDDNPSFFSQINIEYIHKFTSNFLLEFKPYYQDRRFREKVTVLESDGELTTLRREKISTIGVDISAKYRAPKKWLFGEVSYTYQDRKSNQPGGDLVKHGGKISIGISF